jgi:hypothetical protein
MLPSNPYVIYVLYLDYPFVMLFHYLGVLDSGSCVSVGLSYINHLQCVDPFFVSMCIVGLSLWRAASGLIVLVVGMFVFEVFPISLSSVLSHMF